MIGTQEKLVLTNPPLAANLYELSKKTKVGIEAPRIGQDTRPLSNVVFLCPPKTQAALCHVLSVMVGCIEQPVKRLAGSYAGSFNLMHPTAKQLKLVGGGYPLYIGITA
ncbi:MAG: hypothetical protein QX197_10060 [Methylococcaceae bacterium]